MMRASRCPTACGTPAIAAVAAEMGIVMPQCPGAGEAFADVLVSRMYGAQQTAEPIAKPIPTISISPARVASVAAPPINASAGHSRARLV